FFFPAAVSLAILLTIKGAVDTELAWAALLVLPGGIGAATLGTWLSPRLSGTTFRRLVGTLLICSAITLAAA
ncbi:MAG: putative membrane protein YfcA, partial [Kiritimatiellia bacterium]